MIFFCLDRTVALFRSHTQTLCFISQSARIMMSELAGEAATLDESHSQCLSFRRAARVGYFVFTSAQCFPPAHELILTAVLLLVDIFWLILHIDECILRFPLSGMISSQFGALELPCSLM